MWNRWRWSKLYLTFTSAVRSAVRRRVLRLPPGTAAAAAAAASLVSLSLSGTVAAGAAFGLGLGLGFATGDGSAAPSSLSGLWSSGGFSSS
jgi:hypothetical protein